MCMNRKWSMYTSKTVWVRGDSWMLEPCGSQIQDSHAVWKVVCPVFITTDAAQPRCYGHPYSHSLLRLVFEQFTLSICKWKALLIKTLYRRGVHICFTSLSQLVFESAALRSQPCFTKPWWWRGIIKKKSCRRGRDCQGWQPNLGSAPAASQPGTIILLVLMLEVWVNMRCVAAGLLRHHTCTLNVATLSATIMEGHCRIAGVQTMSK